MFTGYHQKYLKSKVSTPGNILHGTLYIKGTKETYLEEERRERGGKGEEEGKRNGGGKEGRQEGVYSKAQSIQKPHGTKQYILLGY